MKTIYNLIDRLNKCYDMTCRVKELAGGYYLEDDLSAYVYFENGSWDILSGFCMLHREVQKEIMDFIYSTDNNHWFDDVEKKYNIIIGEDVRGHNFVNWKSAYRKTSAGIEVWDTVKEEDLMSEICIFTESEIEDLKSKVSEHSAKIIDLAKVEVEYVEN